MTPSKKRGGGKKVKQPRPGAKDDFRREVFERVDILAEVAYIVRCAQRSESHVVSLEGLVLFSTATRDAWLLDAEDRFALFLCQDGEPRPHRIIQNERQFAIEWTADFAIDQDAFVVHERSGRSVAIHGYPVAHIVDHCRLALTATRK